MATDTKVDVLVATYRQLRWERLLTQELIERCKGQSIKPGLQSTMDYVVTAELAMKDILLSMELKVVNKVKDTRQCDCCNKETSDGVWMNFCDDSWWVCSFQCIKDLQKSLIEKELKEVGIELWYESTDMPFFLLPSQQRVYLEEITYEQMVVMARYIGMME